MSDEMQVQEMKDWMEESDKWTNFCDITSAFNISKNSVQHFRTKHIELKYHFFYVLVGKNIIIWLVCLQNLWTMLDLRP